MNYRIDSMSLRDATLTVEGWAIGSNEKKVKIHMTDLRGREIPCEVVERDRVDVMQKFGADRMCGFTASAPFERGMDVWVVLTDGPEIRRIRANEARIRKKNSLRNKKTERLLALCHMETLQVAWDFYKDNGLAALVKKSVHKIRRIDEDYDYSEWEAKVRISPEELAAQRESWKAFEAKPLISVVIPAYNTDDAYLRMLFDSLRDQTYPNLEIIVADGSDKGESVRKVTQEYAQAAEERNLSQPDQDLQNADPHAAVFQNTGSESIGAQDTGTAGILQTPRFIYVNLEGNRGIAENTNAGLKAATGSYIALCDHDDELPLYAFFAVVKTINENPGAQFIYTDEDKIDFDGKAVFEPHFKSDYNPELLTSVNYICHLSVIRKDLLEQVGGFQSEFDGAQDYDFFLRCTEKATDKEARQLQAYREELKKLLKEQAVQTPEAQGGAQQEPKGAGLRLTEENLEKLATASGFLKEDVLKLLEGRFTSAAVIHVPDICYHWRYHQGSTAENPQSKLYAFEAGARAIKAHYDRTGVPYADVEKGVTYGFYHTLFRKKPEGGAQGIPGTGAESSASQTGAESSVSKTGAESSASQTGAESSVSKNGEESSIGKIGPKASLSENEEATFACEARQVQLQAGSFPGDDVKVSIIIPNKDHVEDLDKCMRSIVERSNFRNIEFIIVENNSSETKTFDYYRNIDNNPQFLTGWTEMITEGSRQETIHGKFTETGKSTGIVQPEKDPAAGAATSVRAAVSTGGTAAGETVVKVTSDETIATATAGEASIRTSAEAPATATEASGAKVPAGSMTCRLRDISRITVKVVKWEREFNYSAINNFGAKFATGQMLLLLNNDVEIIGGDAITEMVAYCLRPEIGAVGARLNYADDTIQHAGVIVGMGGIAGAAFVGMHEKENSYMHRMMCTQDYSAVTAACLMMRKDVFEEVGGLREELAVAFNDIDLCMKIRAHGYRVVYDAYSTWHHYESKSRGLEDTPEKVLRFNNEIAVFASHWGGILKEGDPYYHRVLTLRKANFALKDLATETIGEPFKLELDVEEQLKAARQENRRRGR